MEDEQLAQRLSILEREIIALRQHLIDIKGMIAGLSGAVEARNVTANYQTGRKTIGEHFGSISPD